MLRGTLPTCPVERSRNSATGKRNSKLSSLALSTEVHMLGDEAVRSHEHTPKAPAGPSKRRNAWRVLLSIGSMLSTETMTRKLKAVAGDWPGSFAADMLKFSAELPNAKSCCSREARRNCCRRRRSERIRVLYVGEYLLQTWQNVGKADPENIGPSREPPHNNSTLASELEDRATTYIY